MSAYLVWTIEMGKREEIEAQTEIRRRLLANGYVPLANKDKMCILKGWPSMFVDEAQINVWADQWARRGTGVRIEGGLAVIDVDVNDADAVQAIIDALPEDLWDVIKDAPVRRGKGAKEAWFVRLAEGEEPFYHLASSGYSHPDDPDTVHRVEIFAGDNGGRQFGVYGARTLEDDVVRVAHRWIGGRGLCEVPLRDLPTITREQAVAIATVAGQTLRARGWVYDAASKGGFSSGKPIYDLDGQTFETRDHGPVDLAGLQELCEAEDTVRLSASWFEGPAAVNMTRCIASLAAARSAGVDP